MLTRLLLILLPVVASAKEMPLIDFLNTAWSRGPVQKGEILQNQASDEFVSAVRGKYLPQLSLDAIDSTGFPASNSGLNVGGMMASPFRSGPAGGIVVEQMIYDFGRIQSLLRQSKADKSVNLARLAAEKFRFLLVAGQTYLECARARSLQTRDGQLMHWAQINLRETMRFMKTGQRSIIDSSLVKTEVDNLKLELDQLSRYEQSLIEQMKLFGADGGCKNLSETWQTKIPASLQVEAPSILLAKAQIELAEAGYESARASQLPSIKAMGSAGGMQDVRLVDRDNYAAGIGVTFPIWNGGEDARREQAYKYQTDYQKENLKTAQLEYSAQIKNLTDEFARYRDALAVLDVDLEQVRKSMKLATQRYRLMEGPLIDVREAFHQLRTMELERINVMRSLGATSLQLGMLRADKMEPTN